MYWFLVMRSSQRTYEQMANDIQVEEWLSEESFLLSAQLQKSLK